MAAHVTHYLFSAKSLNNAGTYEWRAEDLVGLSPSMAAELRRLSVLPMNATFKASLAREYQERRLSPEPVRAVLGGSYPPAVGMGLLVVTDQDIVAYGWGPGNSQESIVIAREWIVDVKVRWRRRSGSVTIMLHDSGGRYERELKFKGDAATSDLAERWRLAALG